MTRPAPKLLLPLLCMLMPLVTGTRGAAQQGAGPTVVVPMNTPFLFTYGTWDKRAMITEGEARLDADGPQPQGRRGRQSELRHLICAPAPMTAPP